MTKRQTGDIFYVCLSTMFKQSGIIKQEDRTDDKVHG